MAKKVKKNKFEPKLMKVVLRIITVFAAILLITALSLKIWVSTWQNYKSDEFGFSLRIPNGWDIKDPRKDENDAQFVFDDGSILKFGDAETNFPADSEGEGYGYRGDILVYIYENPPSKHIGLEVVKIGSDGISKDFIYSNGIKSFMISISASKTDSLIKKIRLKTIEALIVNSFTF